MTQRKLERFYIEEKSKDAKVKEHEVVTLKGFM